MDIPTASPNPGYHAGDRIVCIEWGELRHGEIIHAFATLATVRLDGAPAKIVKFYDSIVGLEPAN